MRLTAMVVYILIGARVFSLVFQGVGGKEWIEHLLIALPGGQLGFLIFVNVFIFVVAFFLDFFEIAFIIIPLLAPVADKLGIDLDLVRRADLRQHPDQLHASAVRLRAVLPARHRARHRSRRPTSTGARSPGSSCRSSWSSIVIFWPGSVTYWLDKPVALDPSKFEIPMPQLPSSIGLPPPKMQ